jgi:hypothetical protein
MVSISHNLFLLARVDFHTVIGQRVGNRTWFPTGTRERPRWLILPPGGVP